MIFSDLNINNDNLLMIAAFLGWLLMLRFNPVLSGPGRAKADILPCRRRNFVRRLASLPN